MGISNYDSAVTVGSKMYLFGGVSTIGMTPIIFNNVFIYDTATDTWSAGASMPSARFGSAVGWDGGDKIYVMGGLAGLIHTNTWEYSIAGNSWQIKTPMPVGAYRMHGATDTIFGALHAYGNGFNSPEHRIYNYLTDTHSTGLPVPVGITDPATASIPGLGIIQAVAGAANNGSGPQLTHIHETFTPSWLGSFPGNAGGNVSNTCGAIFFDGVHGYFSIVGGFNGTTTVSHNQFVQWI